MSTNQASDRREPLDAGELSLPRLGYLLKHAQLLFRELTAATFAALGIRPQEWAALNCLDEQHGLSQKEAAELLGVDRTTMVALVDELQGKGLVARLPQVEDRRKNTVSLTAKGRRVLQRGAELADDCEQQFLAALSGADAERLKQALHTVILSREGR